jgi:hypothetical protein
MCHLKACRQSLFAPSSSIYLSSFSIPWFLILLMKHFTILFLSLSLLAFFILVLVIHFPFLTNFSSSYALSFFSIFHVSFYFSPFLSTSSSTFLALRLSLAIFTRDNTAEARKWSLAGLMSEILKAKINKPRKWLVGTPYENVWALVQDTWSWNRISNADSRKTKESTLLCTKQTDCVSFTQFYKPNHCSQLLELIIYKINYNILHVEEDLIIRT